MLDTIYKTPSLLGPLDTGKLATLLLWGYLELGYPSHFLFSQACKLVSALAVQEGQSCGDLCSRKPMG